VYEVTRCRGNHSPAGILFAHELMEKSFRSILNRMAMDFAFPQ